MNHLSSSKASRVKFYAAFASIAAGVLLSATVKAQTPGDTVYFDPTNSGTTTAGGTGDFSTSNFWDPTTQTEAPFVSGTTPVIVPGTPNTTEIAAYGETAVFNGPGSTVAVSLPVNPYSLQVGVTSGTETFGTTGAEAQISLPLGDGVNLNPININSSSTTGTENVVFNSNLNFQIAQPYYGGVGINSYTSGNVTFNGGITFSNYTTDGDSVGEPDMQLSENAGGTFTINSAVTALNMPNSTPIANFPYLLLNKAGGVVTLTSNASFNSTEMNVQAGTVLDQGASFTSALGGPGYAISVGGTGQYLTDAANVNVTAGVEFNSGGGTIGGATADTTTFSAQEIVAYSGAPIDLTAAAGGRVNFTGDIHSGQGYSIVKIGAGTIALNDTQGRAEDQTGGWEVQNGTMLLNGSYSKGTSISGSGVQIDNVAKTALSSTQTYATLGGTGDTSVAVTAVGANSSITPGDPTVNGGIGALTLAGGLTASSGLTLNFVLNGEGGGTETPGVNNSVLNVLTLTLNGPVTMNFTTLDTVATGVYYTVIEGLDPDNANAVANWSGVGNPAFTFNAPAGYQVESYILDTTLGDTQTFSVEFEAVPEPSVYGLLGIGLVGLVAINRFRRLGRVQD